MRNSSCCPKAAFAIGAIAASTIIISCAAADALAQASRDPSAQSPEEKALFEQAFGKRPKSPTPDSIPAPLLIESRSAGQIQVRPTSQGRSAELERAPLVKELRPWVNDETLRALGTEAAGRWISFDALNRAGLRAEFDSSRLEARILVPAAIRRPSVVSFRDDVGAPSGSITDPATTSAFVNVNVGQEFRRGFADSQSSPQANGRQPFRSELDGALNVASVVAESSASYTENASSPWQRGDSRLVKDDSERMVRYTLGDFNYSPSGFQRFVPAAGVSVQRNFTLQPYRVTRPSSRREIFLRTRSTVDVYMNGRFLRRLDLPAGRHLIRDFPISTGLNDVRLDITDEVGRRETVVVPYVFDDDALAEGFNEFTYSVGFLSTPTLSGRVYDTSLPTATLIHRVGVSDRATLGAFAQGNRLQAIAGPTALLTTQFGKFGLEPAWTRADGASGGAFRLNYLYVDHRGPDLTPRNFTAFAESRTLRFAPMAPAGAQSSFASSGAGQTVAHELGAGYSQSVPWVGTLSTNGSMQLPRSGARDAASGEEYTRGYLAAASWVRSWWSGFDTTLTLSRSRDTRAMSETTLFGSLIWTLPGGGQFVSANANTASSSARADWNYQPANLVGAAGGSVGVERDPAAESADGRIDYTGNRGRLGAAFDVSRQREGSYADHTQQSFTLRGGTALALAASDGNLGVAVSRPITDSFVMVRGKGKLSGERIDVNPQGEGTPEATTGLLGPAVIPHLASYRYYQVNLAFPEVRAGYTLPSENFVVLPDYRSGTLISLDSQASVYLKGRLIGSDGKPMGLLAGEVRPVGPRAGFPAAPPLFFTNRSGVFGIEGLEPGKYVIIPYDDALGAVAIEIRARSEGLVDLGVLKVPAAGNAREGNP